MISLPFFLQLFVHVNNMETGLEYYWPREKFYNRLCVMQELFDRFDDDSDSFNGQLEDVSPSASLSDVIVCN